MKRLKNIEDKSEEHLKAIKSKNENIKEVTDFVRDPLNLEAKVLIEEITIIQRDVDYRKLKNIGGNGVPYDLILVIIKHLKNFLKTFIKELSK